MFGIQVRNTKICLFPWECFPLCIQVFVQFQAKFIHMFLIQCPKLITVLCKAHLKSVTFEVALSYLFLKQEVTFPMRALDLSFRRKRVHSKLQGAHGFRHVAGVCFSTLLLDALVQSRIRICFIFLFLQYSVQNSVYIWNLIFLSLTYF